MKDSTSRKPTVSDVARRAGVSVGSVSRVLTGKNWVSDDLRKQVLEAASELNYIPNSVAQSLKTQRTMTVGAIVSDMANPLHGSFLTAVQERLELDGYFLIVANDRSQADRDVALLELFGRGRVDGVIAGIADELHPRTLQALESLRLPVVFHDRDLLSIGDAVGPDHRMGAHEATRHLIGLGHRRIALMTPSASIRPGRERLEGYRQALREAGIPHEQALEAILEASGGDMAFSAAKQMLGHAHRPTAVICLGTQMLAGLMSAVGTLALSVPDELSLIGIGDTELVRLSTPAITAVRWDIAQCGKWAAQMMLERLRGEGEKRPFRMLEVPTEMVLRHSCAPPFTQR